MRKAHSFAQLKFVLNPNTFHCSVASIKVIPIKAMM